MSPPGAGRCSTRCKGGSPGVLVSERRPLPAGESRLSTKTNLAAKKPIQPFVPVRPNDRTQLYSHQELRALTSTDPRNELDELSEPHRFTKEVKQPDACFEPEARAPRGGTLLLTFLAGAAIGGVLAALASPKTGAEFRGELKNLSRQAKRELQDQVSQPTHSRTN